VTEYKSIRIEDNAAPEFKREEILAENINNKYLKLYPAFNRDIVVMLKCIPLCRWNNEENCRVMPYTEYGLEELQKIANSFQLDFRVFKKSGSKGLPRKAKHPGYLRCPDSFVLKLKELGYSENCIHSYTDITT